MFEVPISIAKSKLANSSSKLSFERKAISTKGALTSIFVNSFKNVLEKKLHLRNKEHYDLKKFVCKRDPTSETNEGESNFDFSMRISEYPDYPFPEFLLDIECEETINLQDELIEEMEAGILIEYGVQAEVLFTGWGFGSIKINGSISVLYGEFSKELKNGILSTIKEVASVFFHSPNVDCEELPDFIVDDSPLQFCLHVTCTDEKVIEAIERNQHLLSEWIIDDVNGKLEQGKMFYFH